MTTSPTLTEFTTTVREAFGYLGSEFAFREQAPPRWRLEANPFIVWFVNPTTLVQVEGINWGFAAQLLLGPADGEEGSAVPFWAILKNRRPDLYEQPAKGQLGDVRSYATALRDAASDVLRGDFGVLVPARAIVDAQRIEHGIQSAEEKRKIAVIAAAEAFRAGDFARVVELLRPHTELLTPAERARLEYARARG